MSIDDFAEPGFVDVRNRSQHADRAIEVDRVQPDDGHVEGGAVLDEHATVPVVEHTARRSKRELALVVVLRHLLESGVLDDLEDPEADDQQDEERDHDCPKREDPRRQRVPLFGGPSHVPSVLPW